MKENTNSLIQYYKLRAKEYERIYHKPERQEDLKKVPTYSSNSCVIKTFLKSPVVPVTGHKPLPQRRSHYWQPISIRKCWILQWLKLTMVYNRSLNWQTFMK